jgi:hypothetical protein
MHFFFTFSMTDEHALHILLIVKCLMISQFKYSTILVEPNPTSSIHINLKKPKDHPIAIESNTLVKLKSYVPFVNCSIVIENVERNL